MGRVAPPPPLSNEEIERRIANGARTLEEIDPAFWNWHQRQLKSKCFTMMVLMVSTLIALATIMVILMRGEPQ